VLGGLDLGLAWRLSGFALPEIPRSLLKFLGDSAAPCALVATGMALNAVSLRGARFLIIIVAALKLVLHPLLVWFLAAKVFTLPPVWIGCLVLFAACPTGINSYLVAERYKKGEAVTSGAIALSTILAIGTMTVAVAAVIQLGYRQ
jgi:predicted permease